MRTIFKSATLITLVILSTSIPDALANSAATHVKPIVAVSSFDNRSSYRSGAEYSLSNALGDQLTDALIQTDAFVVLERQMLQDILDEQGLAASERASTSQSARIGQLTGAQVLVMGTVTDFEMTGARGGGGINLGGIRLGRKTQRAKVGLIVRLVDTTSAQVLASQQVTGEAETSRASIGLDLGDIQLDGSNFQSTPLGEATQKALDEATEFIAREARQVRFRARVVMVEDDRMAISAGARNNIQTGTRFQVMSVGRELTDPYTGELLGYDQSPIGSVEVSRVLDRVAYAPVQGLTGAPKVGDFVIVE
jgi:curli biogenesis system outer membrane secretion channel CsgG